MTGPHCPAPIDDYPALLLAHGGGGRLMHSLLGNTVLPALDNGLLAQQGDAAILQAGPLRLAFTTDSYVVSPLVFAGGDIGTLAVCGTVNDLAMVGARPLWLSVGLIIEEGLPRAVLEQQLASLRRAADAAGVSIATGDTKVVERGKGDGLYINTAGIGLIEHPHTLLPARVQEGDVIILSGDVGRHGIAVMACREGLAFETALESDLACLHRAVQALLPHPLHCLRDLTRGGLAAALHEIATSAGLAIALDEAAVPVSAPVAAACELLGLDPLQVACEGRFIALLPEAAAPAALAALRATPEGAGAQIIGRVRTGSGVVLNSRLGTQRSLVLPAGEQLPRIC